VKEARIPGRLSGCWSMYLFASLGVQQHHHPSTETSNNTGKNHSAHWVLGEWYTHSDLLSRAVAIILLARTWWG